jgi:two-component system, OmpR family, phosphate regulon sensor histidine kinase PhoR
MKIGVRGKLFLFSLLLLVVSLATSEIYLVPTVEHDLTQRIRQDLLVRLRLVAERTATQWQTGGEKSDWDALADTLGQAAQARVTLIEANGKVLGDSEVSGQALTMLENHRARPEVAAAFLGQTTDNIRYSATTQMRMVYAATPVLGGSGMVARLSLPLSGVDHAKNHVRALLLGGALVALVAALLMSSAVAVLMARGLRRITAIARRMAAGDLLVRSRSESLDEIGELGRTLDHLAENLSRSLRDLRDDRDLLGRILESMREGVLVMDGEHHILLANPSLREMLLLDSDLVGRSTIEVIRNAELHSIVEKALVANEPMVGEIGLGGLKPRRLMVHASRVSGEPRALVIVLFDVTEMRRLETIRRDFVANVSHELRTPIASVRSAAETLRMAMENDPKAVAQFIDIIERNGRRLGDLVNDLLDLSKVEAKEFRLTPETLDLAALCEKAAAPFAGRASSRRIRLAIEIPNDFAKALGDKSALDRILTNLIDNALKYSQDGSSVTIGAREAGAKLQVLVSDTGPGIDAKHLPRLFERFYRVDPGRSRDMGGTGLGLSIVKHLVEALGGAITVESTPGKGSIFAFTLPRAT